MAAREDELQALVGEVCRVHGCVIGVAGFEQAGFRGQDPLAADAIRRSVPSRGHQPGARVVRNTRLWPAFGSNKEGLLRGLLGEVEVAEKADQGGQNAAPFLAEDVIERGYQYTSEGRISTAPPKRAAGTRAATSMAASRSSA